MPTPADFPTAHVAAGARLGDGVVVGPGAVIGDAELGAGVVVGPGAVIGDGVSLGERVYVAAHASIRDGCRIGADCVIEEGALLGKGPRLGALSTSSSELPPPLVIESRVAVCSGAIVFAGGYVASQCVIGDHAYVRERARIGEQTVIGRGSSIDNDVLIGARVRVQTLVYVTAHSVVEDDVFLGPGAFTTNDRTSGRRPEEEPLRGVVLRRACRIGGAVVLAPGVEVGEDAFVGAGAVVIRDVPAHAIVRGVPARAVGRVGAHELLGR